MIDEKAGVDNMMKNIIETELKEGNVNICLAKEFFIDEIPDKSKLKGTNNDYKNKIDEFIQKGCSYILQSKTQSFRTDQNG